LPPRWSSGAATATITTATITGNSSRAVPVVRAAAGQGLNGSSDSPAPHLREWAPASPEAPVVRLPDRLLGLLPLNRQRLDRAPPVVRPVAHSGGTSDDLLRVPKSFLDWFQSGRILRCVTSVSRDYRLSAEFRSAECLGTTLSVLFGRASRGQAKGVCQLHELFCRPSISVKQPNSRGDLE
jgi:hypothetical protein